MDNRFKEGQKLRSILFPDNSDLTVGETCKSITVVMENGQMAGVPWALVEYTNYPDAKFNLALMEGVALVAGSRE